MDAGSVAAIVTVTLLAAQAALLATRIPPCTRRSEPVLLAVFLVFLAGQAASPLGLSAHGALSAAAVWSAGAFLLQARGGGRSRQITWGTANAVFLLVLGAAIGLGYRDTSPFIAFRAFGSGLLAAFPLVLLLSEAFRSRSPSLIAGAAGGCLWLIAGAAEIILPAAGIRVPHITGWPILLLSASAGRLVFRDGYPSRTGWRGVLEGLDARERLLRDTWSRLMEAENALAAQDRLIAAGLLALGAAHEFKNTLSHARATAEHGLGHAAPERKDESLRLILRQLEAGRESAIGLLEKLSGEGREPERTIDASRDFGAFLRMARAAFRPEGLRLSTVIAPDVRFSARQHEVEQVLLNLVMNAVESYAARGISAGKPVVLSARCEEGCAVIEVRDEAGGVAPEAAHRLFSLAHSGTGSTGLGLYLAQSLTAANGGTIEHIPHDGGSVFRLIFPLAER